MDKQSSFNKTRERLEEIVVQIKAKDMPLEKSLDLYEEALRLGSACAEMIDRTDFSADELEEVGFELDIEVDAVEDSPDDTKTDGGSELEEEPPATADADEDTTDGIDQDEP